LRCCIKESQYHDINTTKKKKLLHKLEDLVPDDYRKGNIIAYFEKDGTFLLHTVKTLEIQKKATP